MSNQSQNKGEHDTEACTDDILPKNEISKPFNIIAWPGIFLFRIIFWPKITFDNFAIVRLSSKSASGPEFIEDNHLYGFKNAVISDIFNKKRGPLDTTDNRRRYMSLKQQSLAGYYILSIVAFFVFSIIDAYVNGVSIGGVRNYRSDSEISLFDIIWIVSFFGVFLSFWGMLNLIIAITGQIYEEDEA